jgi:TRAP-type C4-dicarboxylate transport system permease small subunit
LQWFLHLLKERGLNIKKVLEIIVLIGLWALVAMTSLPVGKLAHSIYQHALPFDHGLHQLSRGRWWRRGWLFLILIATTLMEIVRHLQNA